MANERQRLTPMARSVLEAAYRGRVVYMPGSGDVVMRTEGPEVVEVTRVFSQLMAEGLVFVQPFDEAVEPPTHVPCWPTEAGEKALEEAAQAARKRKAKT